MLFWWLQLKHIYLNSWPVCNLHLYICVTLSQIGSPTAMATEVTEKALRSAATQHGLYVPSGAFWGGEDIRKMADRGTLQVCNNDNNNCIQKHSSLSLSLLMRILMIKVIIMILVIIMIIVIALKGAIHDFYNLITASQTVSNMYAQAAKAQIVWISCATHRAPITCNVLCVTWYEGTASLLSLTVLKSHLFLDSLYWLKPLADVLHLLWIVSVRSSCWPAHGQKLRCFLAYVYGLWLDVFSGSWKWLLIQLCYRYQHLQAFLLFFQILLLSGIIKRTDSGKSDPGSKRLLRCWNRQVGGQKTNMLTDWLTDWLTDLLTAWLVSWLAVLSSNCLGGQTTCFCY